MPTRKDGGAIGCGVIILILAIIALALDQLSYYTKIDEGFICNNDGDYAYCGYDDFRIKCEGSSSKYEWEDCADDSDVCKEIQSSGSTFLAFTIIGAIAIAVAILFSLPYTMKFRSFVRFVYIASGLCFLIAFIVWASKGCQAQDGYDDYDLGASSWLVLIAGILSIADGVFEWYG